MRLIGLILVLSLVSGCTTFSYNEGGIRRACKAGVVEYSDDTVTLKCQQKSIGKENQ